MSFSQSSVAPDTRHYSDLTVQEMHNFLDEISFLSMSLNGMNISTHPKEKEEQSEEEIRGCKRRRIECADRAGPTSDFCVHQRDDMESMPSLVRVAPSFRGRAMRFFTVSMGSVQRTISGLTSGLSFLSPRPCPSSQSTSSEQSVLSVSRKPEVENAKIVPCSLHQLMLLDIGSAQAKDLNEICPSSLSPLFGRGPLHFALYKGAPLKVVEDLLVFDPRATRLRDMDGMTPLHLALKFKAPVEQAVLEVIAMDPQVADMKDNSGKTPLDWALYTGVSATIIRELKAAKTMGNKCPAPSKMTNHVFTQQLSLVDRRDSKESGLPCGRINENNSDESTIERDGFDKMVEEERNGDTPFVGLVNGCLEQTKLFYLKVEEDMKLMQRRGHQVLPLGTEQMEQLTEMGHMLRSLNMYCDRLISSDHKPLKVGLHTPRRACVCDTIEVAGGTRQQSSIASSGSTDPSLGKTTDTTRCSQSTTWTTVTQASSAEDESIAGNPALSVGSGRYRANTSNSTQRRRELDEAGWLESCVGVNRRNEDEPCSGNSGKIDFSLGPGYPTISSLNETLPIPHSTDRGLQHTDQHPRRSGDVALSRIAGTSKTKQLSAYQTSMKEQKTTDAKLRLIMDITTRITLPPSEAGPRRFFFRVQKIARCLQSCHGGNVESFCRASPKLDIARYKCPNGENHRFLKGKKSLSETGTVGKAVGI